MIVRTIASLERQAERTRKCFSGLDTSLPFYTPDHEHAALDLRCVLDAPKMLGAEIHRLRRLVRKHGGRP